MKYYAKFDKNGFPIGFWNNEIFPEKEDNSLHPSIPEDVIEITHEQWTEFIENSGERVWKNDQVVPYDPPPLKVTVEMVKNEARKRILSILTEDQQRNTLAAVQVATMTFGADPSNWPEDLQQLQSEAMTAWAEIRRLRQRSNEIEQMKPIPANIGDDELWE